MCSVRSNGSDLAQKPTEGWISIRKRLAVRRPTRSERLAASSIHLFSFIFVLSASFIGEEVISLVEKS